MVDFARLNRLRKDFPVGVYTLTQDVVNHKSDRRRKEWHLNQIWWTGGRFYITDLDGSRVIQRKGVDYAHAIALPRLPDAFLNALKRCEPESVIEAFLVEGETPNTIVRAVEQLWTEKKLSVEDLLDALERQRKGEG